MNKKIEICEVNQWVATGNMEQFTMQDVREETIMGNVRGGDSVAGQSIIGCRFEIKYVSEEHYPQKGYVWYTEDETGHLQMWKANYDTSD